EINGVAQTDLDSIITLNNVTENQTVNVTFAQNTYSVTANAGIGGTITGGGEVLCGDSAVLTIVPDDCYSIASIEINGVAQTDLDSIITLNNIAENQTVNVTFEQNMYDVSLSVYLSENLVFTDAMQVACGTDTSIAIPSLDCAHIDMLEVNGEVVAVDTLCNLYDVSENYTIIAHLSMDEFSVVAAVQGNGSITPSDTSWVVCGNDQTYIFTPDAGWFVQELFIDGQSMGTPTSDSYTFYNVSDNHTIEVVFAVNEYIITSSVEPINAGQINPYGTHFYAYGDTVTYNIMPFPNYRIADVLVDGVSVGAVSSYVFEFVDDNHTIVAYFEENIGIVEIMADENVTVYASSNTVYLRADANKTIRRVEIYDLRGRCVAQTNDCSNDMQMTLSVAPGTYVVRVLTENGLLTRKVMITRN
ncbi:MAG: T9SS type A sorting domain-containing protein, partial [Bacteroidales bacterium]|nr:T9SS type A sorting domain-containing protein [Bacteroidales bacterium]